MCTQIVTKDIIYNKIFSFPANLDNNNSIEYEKNHKRLFESSHRLYKRKVNKLLLLFEPILKVLKIHD